MEDKWYSLGCRIKLAKELGIAPDELNIKPVLEMVKCSPFYGEDDDLNISIMADNQEQEDAITNKYYHIVIQKIIDNEAPFKGFMEEVLLERGVI